MDNLHPPLPRLVELLVPGDLAQLVAPGVDDVPPPGEQVAGVPEVWVSVAAGAHSVFGGTVASIRAVAAVTHILLGPHRLHKGRIVERSPLAPPFLPENKARVFGSHLLESLRQQAQRLVPGGLPPPPGDALFVSPNERCLHSIIVVERHDLPNTFGAQSTAIKRMPRVALELHHPPIDYARQHATVLLANPAGGGEPFLFRGPGRCTRTHG